MDSSVLYTGHITFFSNSKKFGFIDSAERENIYFFYSEDTFPGIYKKSNPSSPRAAITKGAEVTFRLRHNSESHTGIEAWDITVIRNERVELLINRINENKPHFGFIKKIGEKYYVKDKETYIFLPVKVSVWELNPDGFYEEWMNKLVEYKIVSFNPKTNKIQVYVANRVLSDIYYTLHDLKEKQTVLEATITGKNMDGYHVTIFDGRVYTFLRYKNLGATPMAYSKGDTLEVKIKNITDSFLSIELAY